MTKKLYEVHVEFTYYALADSARDAEWLANTAFDDEDYLQISDAREVSSGTVPEWPGNSLVYGSDTDTTLDEALSSVGLPSVAELKRAWQEKMMRGSRQAPNPSDQRADQETSHGK